MFTLTLRSATLLFAGAAALVSAAPQSVPVSDVTITGTHTGQATWYVSEGYGACGVLETESQFVVAIGHALFDGYPGYSGSNPNNNPVCGRKLTATYQGHTVTATVEDRCTGCDTYDLDFSPTAFAALAPTSVGRLSGVTWVFD